jgi:hypothetical protein
LPARCPTARATDSCLLHRYPLTPPRAHCPRRSIPAISGYRDRFASSRETRRGCGEATEDLTAPSTRLPMCACHHGRARRSAGGVPGEMVHIREVGGSSPLASSRSTPLSSWLARGGSCEDFALDAPRILHSPRTLRVQARRSARATARRESLPSGQYWALHSLAPSRRAPPRRRP